MKDTPPRVERLFREMLMRRTPEERLAMGFELFAASRRLIQAGMAARGEAPSAETLFLRFYGADFDRDRRERILAALRERHAPQE